MLTVMTCSDSTFVFAVSSTGDNIRPGLFKAYAYVGGWLWKTPGTLGNGVLSMLSPIKVEPRE